MDKYRKKAVTKQADPSLWDRIGGLPGAAAAGVRAVSGAMSAPGGALGAAISAGGEGVAESIENLSQIPEAIRSIPEVAAHLRQNPTRTLSDLFSGGAKPVARIGTEAALGAIPFGAVLKEGLPVASALRGAAHAGVGQAARDVARGEDPTWKDVGMAAGTGGLITGGLAGLLGGRTPKAPTGELFEVEPTSVKGGRVLEGKTGSTIPQHPRPIRGGAAAEDPTAWMKSDLDKLLPETAGEGGRVPYQGGEPAPYRSSAKAGVAAEVKAAKAAAKAAKEAAAAEKIAQAREGMVPGTPSVSESVSAPTELGTERMTQHWAPPKEEDEGGDLMDLLSGGSRGVRPPKPPKLRAGIDLETGAPVAARGAEEAFQAWLGKTGLPDTPSTRSQFPWSMFGGEPAASRAPAPRVEPPAQVPATVEAPPKVYEPEVLPAEPVAPRAPQRPQEAYPSPEATGEDIMPLTQDSIARAKAAADAERASIGMGPAPTLEDLGVEGPRSVGFGRSPGATPKLEAGMPPPAGEVAPEEPLGALRRLFKTYEDPLEAAGDRYGGIKEAKAAGQPVEEVTRGIAGREASRLAREAKVAPEAPQAPPGAPVEPVTGLSQTSKAREAALAARKAKQGEKPLTGGKLADLFRAQGRPDLAEQQATKFGSETGAVDPQLLAFLGKTGVGALAGGIAGGAVGHPFLGMAGGAALANAPAILSQLGAHPETFSNLGEKLNTEGVKETASKIWQTLPQIQRFNYLADFEGLPANALFGPYGSAVMAAIEHGLSGDARGWEALKALTPVRFMQEYRNAGQEALELIQHGEAGRAETGQQLIGPMIPGKLLGTETDIPPLQLPGVAMTAGDVASRKILEEAGFAGDEARRITLTSEPESAVPKAIANLGKGERDITSPLMDLMLPFKRTPANIWEQGLQRAPGIGFLMQSMAREVPDPIVQQVVQQLISVGVGGASAWAGANLDPETARIVRRYIQNFAGQYGLAATAGFAAGQAMQRGKPAAPAAATATINALPLPATDTLGDIAGLLTGSGKVPRGILPPQIRDLAFPPKNPSASLNSPTGRLQYKPIKAR